MGPKKKKIMKSKKVAVFTDTSEVDIKRYETILIDLNKELSSLRSNLPELDVKNEELTENFKHLKEDHEDILNFLKYTVSDSKAHIKVLHNTVLDIEEKKRQNAEHCKNVLKDMEKNYRDMCSELTTEIQMLTGKVNSLDELRVIREELTKKFQVQDTIINEQAERHEKEVYETEKTFVIQKDEMKQRLNARLTKLTNDFQNVTEIRVAANAHTVIKENIVNNLEFDETVKMNKWLEQINTQLKEAHETCNLKNDLLRTERNKAVSKSNKSLQLIQDLTAHHQHLVKNLDYYEKLHQESLNISIATKNVQNSIAALQNQIQVLEQNSQTLRNDRYNARISMEYLNLKHDRFSKAVSHCASATEDFLKKYIPKKKKFFEKFSALLDQIYLELKEVQICKPNRPEREALIPLSVMYKKTESGYVPKPVHLLETTFEDKEVTANVSCEATEIDSSDIGETN